MLRRWEGPCSTPTRRRLRSSPKEAAQPLAQPQSPPRGEGPEQVKGGIVFLFERSGVNWWHIWARGWEKGGLLMAAGMTHSLEKPLLETKGNQEKPSQ